MAKHLIHIGYPKAGSTFLQAWFEQHPELRYAPGGGLGGFYSIYELCRPSEQSFKYFVTSYEGIATPHQDAGRIRTDLGREKQRRPQAIKQDQKAVCSVLRDLYPGSTILIITRGFKEMVMSGYSQYVRSGGTLHIADVYQRDLSERSAEYIETDDNNHYDFDYLIGLYAAAFGEENLIIAPYELLRDDQSAFLATLEKKLGLAHLEPNLARLNPSLSPEELYWYPLISRRVVALTRWLGEAPFRRIYRWYIGRTMENKLQRVIRVLRRLRPTQRITNADFPVHLLRACRGKATRLQGLPLYAPYATEYLWDSANELSIRPAPPGIANNRASAGLLADGFGDPSRPADTGQATSNDF